MRARTLLIAATAAIFFGSTFGEVLAGRQNIALFPPQAVGPDGGGRIASLLGQALAEKLRDRFDVHLLGQEEGADPREMQRRARTLGATYILSGTVSRIGNTVTLDLTLAPTEDPGKGRTVFVTAEDKGSPGTGQEEQGTGELPFAYRRMAIEASAKLKLVFFGDGQIGEGEDRRKIPILSGKIGMSRNITGEVVSVSMGDVDRDGKSEVAAAYNDSITIFRVEGDVLVEKARIADAGRELIHLDVGDVNRNGIAEIVAVRYLSGKATADVWEFDGSRYLRIGNDLPYFLRTVDLGSEGIVLVGQESDPVTIFKGPVFRVALDRYGHGELSERDAPVPLPTGTWIYSFVPVRFGKGLRYVTIGEGDRLLLLDGSGKKLWEGIDALSGTGLTVEAPLGKDPDPRGSRKARRVFKPGRLFAADLDGDDNDEIVVVNNIVSAGGFFENLRIRSNAEVLCFGQYGDMLQLAWRTPQVESPAMDSLIDVSQGGKSFRVGIASRDRGKILGRFGEWRMYWVK